jgi:hypothetical protein
MLIIALDFTHIFRPSMIMGNRKENRPLEKIIMKIWTIINPFFIGKLNNYRGIEGKPRFRPSSADEQNNEKKLWGFVDIEEELFVICRMYSI